MSEIAKYALPEGVVGLVGAVDKPAPGTLPLRGDLAHIALAKRYLAAHYVIPVMREAGPLGAQMLLAPRAEAALSARLDPGAPVEALDYAGAWCWACSGPEGPSGYILLAQLAPDHAGGA